MKPVLLTIDLQKDFRKLFKLLKPPLQFDENVRQLTGFFRKKGLPVIHLLTLHKADRSTWTLHMKRGNFQICVEGTEGVKEIEAVGRRPGEPVIYKTRWSAFFGTELENRLRRFGHDTLILAGFMTHACIRVTAIDAYERDYNVLIAKDCIDTHDAAHGDLTLNYLSRYAARVMANEEIFKLIDEQLAAQTT